MAQSEAGHAGSKRGASRASKSSQPADKKRKITTTLSTPLSSTAQSPTASSPAPEKRPNRLPARIHDNKPLPTLPEQQPLALSKDEYQSIAASAVLQSSLDRSRLKWTHDGVLEKYWTKPESGKNARPPPPGNPELKWQKHKGPCRIRIEPHVFEAELYVEEKPKPPPPPAQPQVKQFVPPAYGQAYRPGQQAFGQQQYYQNRGALPAMQQQGHVNPHPGVQGDWWVGSSGAAKGSIPPSPAPTHSSPSRSQQSPAPSQQDKKASPDPVISMLATRASSDPELKALMKEVATGNANPEQLKVFQSHIDELTKLINDKKQKEEDEALAAEATKTSAQQLQQQSEMIQYDGASDNTVSTTPYQQQPQQRPYQPPTAPLYQQQQPTWTPPQPTSHPVILSFTSPGSTEDRFLFPAHSILEAISPQHLLASFLVTRTGSSAANPAGLEAETEYFQPVTLMVEVAYNREHLLECVRRWVKPAEEVRKHMEAVMQRATRAPVAWLPLRLPFKGSKDAEMEEVVVEDVLAAVPVRPAVKYVKKAKAAEVGKEKEKVTGVVAPAADAEKAKVKVEGEGAGTAVQTSAPPTTTAVDQKDAAAKTEEGEGGTGAPAATESGRPRRAVRKSVRISEG